MVLGAEQTWGSLKLFKLVGFLGVFKQTNSSKKAKSEVTAVLHADNQGWGIANRLFLFPEAME